MEIFYQGYAICNTYAFYLHSKIFNIYDLDA